MEDHREENIDPCGPCIWVKILENVCTASSVSVRCGQKQLLLYKFQIPETQCILGLASREPWFDATTCTYLVFVFKCFLSELFSLLLGSVLSS